MKPRSSRSLVIWLCVDVFFAISAVACWWIPQTSPTTDKALADASDPAPGSMTVAASQGGNRASNAEQGGAAGGHTFVGAERDIHASGQQGGSDHGTQEYGTNRQVNMLPLDLTELKVLLENGDMRTMLYAAKTLLENDEEGGNPYDDLAMGIALNASECFPEAIRYLEESLAQNSRTDGNKNCEYLGNLVLALSYHRLGIGDKSRESLEKASQCISSGDEQRQWEAVRSLCHQR